MSRLTAYLRDRRRRIEASQIRRFTPKYAGKKVNGVLFLYFHPLQPNAATIMEHVNALPKYSNYPVWKVNTQYGFPRQLEGLQFDAIVLHYSIGLRPYLNLCDRFCEYLDKSTDSYKIAFFQDEYRFWPSRASFLDEFDVDCVYTLLEPRYFDFTYRKYRPQLTLHHTLTGYVDRKMTRRAAEYAKPDREKTIDIGYRARQLPITMGLGAQEKHEIAVEFNKRASHLGLALDIETAEEKRIYGLAWHKDFLANCRGMLGTESGVSIFDIDNAAIPQYEALKKANPDITDQEAHELLLHRFEDQIYYRTISPRHFEAAAFRICQILFEGQYSGILKPHVHYIPLKKDYSNLDEVIRTFRDYDNRREITSAAFRDIIESGRYDYQSFANGFDANMAAVGLTPKYSMEDILEVQQLLDEDLGARQYLASYREFMNRLGARRSATRRLFRAAARPVFWMKSQTGRLEYC